MFRTKNIDNRYSCLIVEDNTDKVNLPKNQPNEASVDNSELT